MKKERGNEKGPRSGKRQFPIADELTFRGNKSEIVDSPGKDRSHFVVFEYDTDMHANVQLHRINVRMVGYGFSG